ncbi:hypothetical protein pclt_cds_288 [Pandoravirus celtis]|uniref:Uncharacterized protein n=1 Tax=Pandoravirus celtis TaxID=2568002 RepID=A0A4D6EGD3_9VIRU|nr:hypothetical protein pclt_cds_288 [Pandoravirus celtis]
MNTPSADVPAARRASLKRPREDPPASSPMLIDLLSDDEGDLVVGSDARPAAHPPISIRAPSSTASNDRHTGRTGRAGLAVDDSDEDEEDDDDDDDEMDDQEDSDDPDDNGSDLDDFIVSDDDDDDDDAPKRGAAADDQDSEAEFVPSDDLDDDDDDDGTKVDDDTASSSHTTHDASSSLSPVVTIASDDDDSDDDGDDDGDNDDKPRRGGAAAVATEETDGSSSTRPAKRARLDETEALSVDPNNIVSGKRCRRTTERYMDRHFMEFMVRDVPPSQIAAVFDDEDEYFQSGISLTDSSEEGDDDGEDEAGAEDLDSSDYEDLDALSSSSPSARGRHRRRRSDKSAGDAAVSAVGGLPERARSSAAGGVAADLSRPPSTVAALLRSLAAQPGGIRPSVASPRSAPTSRARPPP